MNNHMLFGESDVVSKFLDQYAKNEKDVSNSLTGENETGNLSEETKRIFDNIILTKSKQTNIAKSKTNKNDLDDETIKFFESILSRENKNENNEKLNFISEKKSNKISSLVSEFINLDNKINSSKAAKTSLNESNIQTKKLDDIEKFLMYEIKTC